MDPLGLICVCMYKSREESREGEGKERGKEKRGKERAGKERTGEERAEKERAEERAEEVLGKMAPNGQVMGYSLVYGRMTI